ncbi:MAG: biotin transporter BioY [Eubacterium sp.]|nr:biotin transporter BioY [Eubacterium sp.]
MKDTWQKQNNKLKTIDLAYIGLSAALIAVCSWISIPLTVPITLQTLGVCLVSGLFGAKRGTLSVFIYILLGAIGVPVFSGFKGGIGALFGATGGYIIGFIFTALIVGIVSDKTEGNFLKVLIAMIVGVLICYVFGTAWFAVVYAKTSEPASLKTILGWCVLPFLLPDAVKIILSAVLTNRLKKFIKKRDA